MEILYASGDATRPLGDPPQIIAHICNNLGTWGAGFVLAVSDRWPEPKAHYRWCTRRREGLALGQTHLVKVDEGMWVANMIGQEGVGPGPAGPPIRYGAVDECLRQLASAARIRGASVHMPRIGCGLAGGRWDRIEPLVINRLIGQDIPVTVYQLPQ